ncbi:MAG: PAS domain-containing protein [Gammaproteobacteria bacterium]|nr:PAS domain-containing protein [Gammaproteobacteria bacterium]
MSARILVVEDEPLMAQDIRLKLEETGYKIIGTCASGAQAVELAATNHPDLILMDIVLEGTMTGIEAARLIREKNDIPIIYLTAYADDKLIEQAKITDPFGYILKPPVARELHAVITLALYRAEANRKLQMAAWTSAALMSICDAVIIFDQQGLVTDINLAAIALLRTPREQALGQPITTLVRMNGHNGHGTLSDLIARTIRDGKVYVCEDDTNFIVADDKTIPVHFSISPVHDQAGRALGAALVVYQDYERRKAAHALQASKQRLDAVMDNTTALVCIKDINGHYLLANSQYEQIIGLRREEIIGKTDFDLFPTEIATELRTNDQHVLKERRPMTYEEHVIQKDGPRDYISAKVPLYDAFGRSQAICSISTDISNQKRRQRGYKLLNSWTQTLTDQLSHPSIEEQAFYLNVCNGARELVNADIGALPYLDETKTQFTYLAAAGPHAELLQGTSMPVKSGGLCGWVAQHGDTLCVGDLSKDSRVIPELAAALNVTAALVVPLLRNQQVIGGLSTFRNGAPFDTLDQELLTLFSQDVGIALDNLHLRQSLEYRVSERTAQLSASNDELKAFSYSVSHDLRAPLRRIVGFSNVLLEEYTNQLDSQGQDYLRRVGGSAERMSELIDDLLALSRVAQFDMQPTHVDLSALAEQIALELQNTEPKRNVEFLIAPDIQVQGDSGLLHIALDNLFSNAWKFTRKKAAARIEFGHQDQKGEEIYFVRDNGAGFDMAYVDKLFTAFQRLHDTSDFEGTGIGLATVRRIVRRHNGRVWVEGSPGHGATFYFTLGQ